MKIKRIIFLSLIFLGIILISNSSEAFSSGVTYFDGDALKLGVTTVEAELISNEITINEETSKIQNNYIFVNKLDKEIATKGTVKIEDPKLGVTIDDLNITINGTSIKNYKIDNEGVCTFALRIPPKEGVQIKISYTNGSDLKNAKVIKYSLEKYKMSHIKKFSFKVHFAENSIPLVQKIYPNCYNYDLKQDISVEYYDFDVNNLTKDFIIQKETYKNLLYARVEEFRDDQIELLKALRDGQNPGIDKYSREDYNNSISYNYKSYKIGEEYFEDDNFFQNLNLYVLYKNDINLKNRFYDHPYYYEYNALIFDLISNGWELNNYSRKVVLDYVLSEGDKKLYIYKSVTGTNEPDENGNKPDFAYYEKSEIEILKMKFHRHWYDSDETSFSQGIKFIEINQTIDGDYIDATDKEKAEYVSMIGADAYLRIAIYDSKADSAYVLGYYDKQDISMIKKYTYTSDYDIDTKTYFYTEDSRVLITDYDNQDIQTYSKVPTFAQSSFFRNEEDGKYVISSSYYTTDRDGFYNFIEFFKDERAQLLIDNNNKRLDDLRKQVETEISEITLSEYEEPKTLAEVKEMATEVKENKEDTFEMFGIKITTQMIIILGSCVAVIVLLFILIIIILIKRKKNKKKEEK